MTKIILKYHEGLVPSSRDELLKKLDRALTPSRFAHVQRVEQMAIKLAKLYGEDPEKASIAGLVHDYAKQRPAKDFITEIKKYRMNPILLHAGNPIWHGMVGWHFVQDELGINDIDILNAVRFHTVGNRYMTKLQQIVYMADYIEMGRRFPGVETARRITFRNLQDGVAYQTKHTLDYLIQNNLSVFPKTLDTYNAWVPQSNLDKEENNEQ